MAVQLLPIRLLVPTSSIVRACRCSTLSGVFFAKLRLKNSPFSSNRRIFVCHRGYSGGRAFSTRPASPGARVLGQNKSLIEDEAELSDWVSDLKSNSFRTRDSSEDEGSSRDRGNQRSRDIDRGWLTKGRGRDSSSAAFSRPSSKMNRGSDSDGFSNRTQRGSSSRKRIDSGDNAEDFRGGRMNERRKLSGVSSDSRKGLGNRGSDSDGYSNRTQRGSSSRRRIDSGDNADDFRGGRTNGFRKLSGVSSDSRKGLRNRGSDSDGYSNRTQRGSSSRRRIDSGDNADDFRGGRTNGFRKLSGVSSDSRKGLGNRFGASSAFNKRGKGDYKTGGILDRPKTQQDLVVSDEEEDEEDEEEESEEEEVEESDDGMTDFDNDFFGDKEYSKDRIAKDASEKGRSFVSSGVDIVKAVPKASVPASDSYLSETRFDQFPLSPLSLKGIKAAGYERMTLVQEATFPVILNGKDVLAKARTGTGKTVAFLLPAIEVVAKLPPPDRDNRRPPINVLVVCPTRELADQAAAEASKLSRFHASIGVQVVMGGTRLALEQKRMQANPCQILVATPGRLRDHMENTPGFTSRLNGVKVLVLDEADRLLDMGFRKDIEKIVAALPKQRQTLLFSATVPDEVRQICYIAMKRDNEFISTVEEGSEETHSQVTQMHLIAPLEQQFSILYRILTDHIAEDVDYKVIVFCTTAMVTKFVADFLGELNLNVREMHSRKPQTYRTRVSKEFKESKGIILVSSDVSARGVDYPDVSLVMQVGVPADRDQYIHRLGRTGRKGKVGKGLLLLAPWEDFFLNNIRDLPITKAESPPIGPDTRKKVERAIAQVEMKSKESAYQAWLGYYNSIRDVGREKSRLVLLANEFSRSMGLDNPPALSLIILRKMGLNNVPGLRTK